MADPPTVGEQQLPVAFVTDHPPTEALGDLEQRVKDAGLPATRLAPAELSDDPAEALAEVGYVILHCPNSTDKAALTEVQGQLQQVKRASDVPVGIVFDHLDQAALTQVVLRAPANLDAPIDACGLDTVDPEEVIRPHLGRRPAPSADAIKIGGQHPIEPDTEVYEQQRSLSLVSPPMRQLITRLRAAITLMDRRANTDIPDRVKLGEHLRPPWDPTSRSRPWSKQDRDGRWTLQAPTGSGLPNLQDLMLAHDTDEARGRLLGATELAAAPSWHKLPPKLLILGESGTGKSLVAKLAHKMLTKPPDGPAAPYVRISCGGLGGANLDHELFGAAPGVFTGVGAVVGKLVQAAYGVAFFDEIGDLPTDTQARLLTFLDDLMLHPAGLQPFFGFVQVIAATNRDVHHRTAVREFRHDLLARFQLRVEIPPLRDRRTEIPHLVDFIAQNPQANPPRSEDGTRTVTHIASDAMRQLVDHDYRQNNFRELEEVVTAALDAARRVRSQVITTDHLTLDRRVTFRPDTEQHVIRVTTPYDQLVDGRTQIEVEDLDELRRLADRRNLPILIADDNDPAVVLDRQLAYTSQSDPPDGPSS